LSCSPLPNAKLTPGRRVRLGLLLSPINSFAAAIALGFLGVRKFFRNIFR
jgi:hypothetical protein